MTVRELGRSRTLADFSIRFRLVVSYQVPMQVEKALLRTKILSPYNHSATYMGKGGVFP